MRNVSCINRHALLSNVCESLRDGRWSASCSLALRYKFAKLLQRKPELVQLFCQPQLSLSFFLSPPLTCYVLGYAYWLIHGHPVSRCTTFGGPTEEKLPYVHIPNENLV